MTQFSVRLKDLDQNGIIHTIAVLADSENQANILAIRKARRILGSQKIRLAVHPPVILK